VHIHAVLAAQSAPFSFLSSLNVEKITIRNLSSARYIFESTVLQMRAHRKG